MDEEDLLDVPALLWSHAWWLWDAAGAGAFDWTYRSFNLIEAVSWTWCAGAVFRRWLRHRHSRLEVPYALAFLLFGASDLREAYALQSWLVWAKLANVIVLFRLRQLVKKRFYPESRMF